MNLRKLLRPTVKTVQAILRWKRLSFNNAPPIFGNSKPKSGSHLLLQILNGFTQIMPYKYVEADPIRTFEKEGRRRAAQEILDELKRIPRGVIGWGGMHEYYKSLPDFGERLKVAITGIDRNGLYMVSVKQRYESVFQWLEQENVMCLRFEDLINNRDVTLDAMLDEVESTGYKIPTPREKALSILAEAIQPTRSHTFRSGKTGNWREHFTDEHKKLFKDVAGDLLVRLRYEKNNDW